MLNSAISVSELNKLCQHALEQEVGVVQVKGEVSQFKKYSSGHWYFTLKDEKSRVSCTMFRFDNQRVNFEITEGTEVAITGRVSIYAVSGQYQLIAKTMQQISTSGILYQQFLKLKEQLREQGYFAAENKKPLPKYPFKVGLITSKRGAVVHDMLHVFKQQAPWVQCQLYDCQVQGDSAVSSLIDALNKADSEQLNVLIIGRGGGSIEELWAFNDEKLAKAIFHCNTPIISAVGHETDHLISDYCADISAPTPTYAAKIVCQNWKDIPDTLAQIKDNLIRQMLTIINSNQLLITQKQSILNANSPQNMLQESILKVDHLCENLTNNLLNQIANKKHQLVQLQNKLQLLDSNSVLKRGYSVTLDSNQQIIRDPKQVSNNDTITTLVDNGKFESQVIKQIIIDS